MGKYLVIIDETEEARKALRFAMRWAVASGGSVQILAIVQPQNFNAFGGVQATIEQEARDRAEAIATSAAGNVYSESGKMPNIAVKVGDGDRIVREYLAEHPDVVALVLGAAADGPPGPLVSHFSAHIGGLPCPLVILPGRLPIEELDRIAGS
ncbi:universal stress protein [Alteriqipengyuania lutimaris]|uniref:Universal stress protein n=1 Tax=Alteriqipengyuania lutimaris TaxID=1538146 RepID=A0A395LMQ2_9SPHN|nr:universal stress protein [Alteriqipengyuania lutimaris]MBB3032876.1 nucleotide-binding universal stress UspA family protein [Alteriqipengyuania lutimaris]RDS78035.1 universal stress protein [Alteriqipengyuania lutimaris]